MRGPAAAANFVSLLFISQNGGNVCLRKTSRSFGLAVADAPHRSDRPSTARSNCRLWSGGILRVRGLPLRPIAPQKRRFPDLQAIDGAAHWQSPGFAELYRKTRQLEVLNAELKRRVDERTEELAHALRNACSPLRTARICNRNPRCFHISRGDSVHATLRKPALNFCSRCEGLATPKRPHSRKRPTILPGETSSFSYYPLRLARQGHRRSR